MLFNKGIDLSLETLRRGIFLLVDALDSVLGQVRDARERVFLRGKTLGCLGAGKTVEVGLAAFFHR